MQGISDPGGHIMRQVQGAAYGVYKKMGGKERHKVGVLLYNIYKSSWDKDRVDRMLDMQLLEQFEQV